MKKVLTTYLFIFSLFGIVGYAQSSGTSSKKALKAFNEAIDFYNRNNLIKALEYCDKSIDYDTDFIYPYLLKVDIYNKTGDINNEILWLTRAAVTDTSDVKIGFVLAQTYFKNKLYHEALQTGLKVLQKPRIEEDTRNKLLKIIELSNFRLYAKANPFPYIIENMGDSINSEYDEYFPALSANGNLLVFTRKVPQEVENNILPFFQEDIYWSRLLLNNQWQKAQSIGAFLNTYNNEGAPYISSNGKVLYFTSCTCPDGLIQCCDIYFSVLGDLGWSRPYKIPEPVNTRHWESQPCISSDGRTLYFVSNRPGGKGRKDIWKSSLENGQWSEPENLGDSINTPEDEICPFIHFDDKTLYFSSNGHIGMGGFDLFMSKQIRNGLWTMPENLGHPLNTESDESRIVINTTGNKAVITSNKDSLKGIDIWGFYLPPKFQPQKMLCVTGTVYDKVNGKPLTSAVELYNNNHQQSVITIQTEPVYENVLFFLTQGSDFGLSVRKKGYLFYSENFSVNDISDSISEIYLDIPLVPIKKGNTVVLKNIFFETNSYKLKKESFIELNKLVLFLMENPEIKIEIGGHTDNQGTEKYNQQLSENRAKEVTTYLLEQKIPVSRVVYKGYGISLPVAGNDTPEGRAKNRRTEFKIVD